MQQKPTKVNTFADLPIIEESEIIKYANNADSIYVCDCLISEHATYPIYFQRPDRYILHLWLDAARDTKKRQDLLWQNCVLLDNDIKQDIAASNDFDLRKILVSAVTAIENVIENFLQLTKKEAKELPDNKWELWVTELAEGRSETDKEEKGKYKYSEKFILNMPTRTEAGKHTDIASVSGSKAAADYLIKPYLKLYRDLASNDTAYFTVLRTLISLKAAPAFFLRKL